MSLEVEDNNKVKEGLLHIGMGLVVSLHNESKNVILEVGDLLLKDEEEAGERFDAIG